MQTDRTGNPSSITIPTATLNFRVVLFALLFLLLAGAVIAFAFSDFRFSETIKTPGRLIRLNVAHPVYAPPDSTIMAVLVSEGEHVAQGQTIILLDPLPYESEIQTLRTHIFRQSAKQNCLRKLNDPVDTTGALPAESPEADAPEATLIREVSAWCQNHRQSYALENQEIGQILDNLVERQRLLNRRLGIAKTFALPSDGAEGGRNASQLRKILDLALAKNVTEAEIAKARNRQRRVRILHDQSGLSELEALAKDLKTSRHRLAILMRQSAGLRIYAPKAGVIKYLRKKSEGATLSDHEIIMQIDPTVDAAFEVVFALPNGKARNIPLNQPVVLKVLGLPRQAPQLIGTISKFSYVSSKDGVTDKTVAHARISEASAAQLQSRVYGMAELSGNMSAVVEVSLPQSHLASRIKQSLNSLGNLKTQAASIVELLQKILRQL